MAARRWYAVQTKPHKQRLVLVRLADAAIPTYHPILQAPGRRGRRLVSLFPNYLFAQIGGIEESVTVRYTPGVRRVVGYGDKPYPVDDEILALIREREQQDGVIRPSKFFRFSPADRVRIGGGAFHGFEALFQRYLPGKERVRVLLELLGRQVPMELSTDELLPANV